MQHSSLNFMLDLETLATTDEDPNVAILSIGCVQFDPYKGKLLDEFYTNVTLKSNMDAGRRICPRTIEWWMGQNEAARRAFTNSFAEELPKALNSFFEFVRGHVEDAGTLSKYGKLWSHGPTFDEAIIRHAFLHVLEWDHKSFPFGFRSSRCNRTALEMKQHLGLKEIRREGDSHNALDDARFQAEGVIQLYAEVKA